MPALVPLSFALGGYKVLFLKGAGGGCLRAFALFLVLCAGLTIWNGVELAARGVEGYGLDPFAKSARTAVVPFVLLSVLTIGAGIPFILAPSTLQATLYAAFVLTIAYCGLQLLSLRFPNPLFDALWPIVEGARDNGGQPAMLRFGRLSGPTMEPAELAKLAVLIFVPWFLYPCSGAVSIWRLALALGLALTTASLTGAVLVALVILVLPIAMTSSHRRSAFAVVLVSALGLLAIGTDLFAPIAHRLADLANDPSVLIRRTYNGAALSLIFEHPFTGVGWSNEVFYFPQRVASIAYLWEVSADLASGNALTAKSLLLRLAMYGGAVSLLLAIGTVAILLWSGDTIAHRRARLTLVLFLVAGLVDGGILTSFYLWVRPALVLGALSHNAPMPGALSC